MALSVSILRFGTQGPAMRRVSSGPSCAGHGRGMAALATVLVRRVAGGSLSRRFKTQSAGGPAVNIHPRPAITIEPQLRTGGGPRELIKYLLFFAPAHLAAGIALGGLSATIGATCWWLHATGRINLWDHVDREYGKMEKIVIVDRQDGVMPRPSRTTLKPPPSRWPGYENIESGEVQDQTPSRFKKFEIPIPLTVALLGWAAGVLWTTTRTAYRSRLDVKLLSFFHDVNFTLCTKRDGKLAQRRLASRSLLSTMFNNEYLAATVRTACGKVTRDDPVVRMQARDAMLVVTALQGPLSELKGSDHLMCDTDANLVEAKYWYALTCSPSTFRAVTISDELVQELKAAMDEGEEAPPPEHTLNQAPHTQRKASRTLRAVVAAIRKLDGMKSLPKPTDMVPLVGWLNVPVPRRVATVTSALHDVPAVDGTPDAVAINPGSDAAGIDGVRTAAIESASSTFEAVPAMTVRNNDADQQRAWADAFDMWEQEADAALRGTADVRPTEVQPMTSALHDVPAVDGTPDVVAINPGWDAAGIANVAGDDGVGTTAIASASAATEAAPATAVRNNDADQQRAWADAFDMWEQETDAALRDTTGRRPPEGHS